MVKDFLKGIHYPFSAIRFIAHHPNLGKFIIIPFIINVLLFLAGLIFFISNIDSLLQIVPKNDAWYFAILYYLLATLLVASFLIVTFYVFTVIGNMIASPFNSVLSERIEELQFNNKTDQSFNFKLIIRDAYRAVMTECKRLLLFICIFIPIFILNFIPVIGQALYFILMLVFTAWGLSFTFMDYAMERKIVSFRLKVQILASRKSLMLGFGSMCFLFGLIPILNLFLIPVCVTAGTLIYFNEFDSPKPSGV
ncbi:sulfate transporter CysZ [bacterium]|nr:sulfate transporter CysZ [bacterium]